MSFSAMSFRPLTGKLVLIPNGVPYSNATTPLKGFRPLTGKLVLITRDANLKHSTEWRCFRPLTGKLVLIVMNS